MPTHVIAAHLAAFIAPVSALMALVYCWRPRSRTGMRLPLVIASAAAMVTTLWAEFSGTDLWRSLKSTLGGSLPAVTSEHKEAAEALVMTTFVFAVVVLSVVWNVLAPGRRRIASAVWAALTTVLALGILVFAWAAVYAAMGSVWAHHLPLQ